MNKGFNFAILHFLGNLDNLMDRLHKLVIGSANTGAPSFRNFPPFPVTILINKEAIDEEQYVKYLGILIDSQLTLMS